MKALVEILGDWLPFPRTKGYQAVGKRLLSLSKNIFEIGKLTAQELNHRVIGGAPWLNMPGCIWIDLPESEMDPVCTVMKVEFDEPIDLVTLDNDVKSVGGN